MMGMRSSSPHPLRYLHSSQLIQRAFDLIAAYTGQKKTAIRQHYAGVAQVSPDTIRAWQGGTARPRRPGEIRCLARDAVRIAKLGLDWLHAFLWAVDAPLDLRSDILLELRPQIAPSTPDCPDVYELQLVNTHTARVVEVHDEASPLAMPLNALGIPLQRPAITIVGGADRYEAGAVTELQRYFTQTLVPFCDTHQIAVVDGGTDCGVMRAIGRARADAQATFPLIGIAPIKCVCLPEEDRFGERAALEPNHSHFLLIEGDNWQQQAHWISKAVTAFTDGASSLTVLANGGEISAYDVFYSLFAGRPVVAIDGTGRLADQFATAVRAGSVNAQHAQHAHDAQTLGYSARLSDTSGFTGTIERLLQI